MKTVHIKMIIGICLTILMYQNSLSQIVGGLVLDKSTNYPVGGALISIKSESVTRFLEVKNDGTFTINLMPGTYSVSVSKSGYNKSQEIHLIIGKDESMMIEIHLNPFQDEVLTPPITSAINTNKGNPEGTTLNDNYSDGYVYERNREKKKDSRRERYYKLGLNAGVFIPTEIIIREIYGNLYSYGLDFEEHGFYDGSNLGVVARYGIEYFHKTGQPKVYGNLPVFDATSKITGIPLTVNIGIISRRNKAKPYFMAGLGYYILKEELSYQYMGNGGQLISETASGSANNIGYQLTFGNVIGGFYAEVKYSKANLSTSSNADAVEIDFGGLRLSVGLKF